MKFIGIKRLWYGDVIKTAITGSNAATEIPTLIAGMKEVKNIHGDTFGYTQDDPTITDYVNAITGKPYHRDPTDAGKNTIAFTEGEYDLEDKAALQGGTVDGNVWVAPKTIPIIYKGIIGLSKTGNLVIFTNANVTGKVDAQEKALGLGVAAVATDNPADGVASEYWVNNENGTIKIPD